MKIRGLRANEGDSRWNAHRYLTYFAMSGVETALGAGSGSGLVLSGFVFWTGSVGTSTATAMMMVNEG